MALPPPTNLPPPSLLDLPLPDPAAYEGEPQEYARALMQRRDEIEREMESLTQVLANQGVNSSTPLIDPEGYPRADIDVWNIRHTRAALARLRTDHRQLSGLLAPALEAAFARTTLNSSVPASAAGNDARRNAGGRPHVNGDSRFQSDTSLVSSSASASTTDPVTSAVSSASAGARAGGAINEQQEEVWPEGVLARVNTVAAGSPAEEAGLTPEDLIRTFGDIDAPSGRGLTAVGALVIRSEGIPIRLRVQRRDERVELTLTPRNGWGGRGLLGCHILPP